MAKPTKPIPEPFPLEATFDVALSFAGEDREYVEKTADVLRRMGIRVFYDKYEQVSLWGKNLYDHMSHVYGALSRFTVLFISKHYARKLWTNHERKSAQARAFSEQSESILPVRFDNSEIPGIHSTIGYIDVTDMSPRKLAELIKEKLGPLERRNFMPQAPDRLLAVFAKATEAEKRVLSSVAQRLFARLSLMTTEERQLISILALNTCPAGPAVDGDLHININLLARLSERAPREIIATCSRIECLDFSYKLTTHDKRSKPKNILRLTYEPLDAPEELSGNWSVVVYAVFSCIADHLCPGCRLGAINRMDFSVLSTLAGFPDAHIGRHSVAQGLSAVSTIGPSRNATIPRSKIRHKRR